LAKKMGFSGRFGNSCGTSFNKDEFCKKHRQYYKFCPYLKDRPGQPWTDFTITDENETEHEEDTESKPEEDTESKPEEDTESKPEEVEKPKRRFKLTKKGGRNRRNKTKRK
jgi:hypothetical protein